MSNPFEVCRHKLGPAPRVLKGAQRKTLLLKAPPWSAQDALARVTQSQQMLLEQGRVASAALVQANAQLWAPNQSDSAALALWSEDARFETDTSRLRELALEVYDLKGQELAEDDPLQPIAHYVTAESSRPLNAPLPAGWGEANARFYLSALLVWRAHLPCGFLTSTVLPMLVLPEKTDAVMILPAEFWADELKDR